MKLSIPLSRLLFGFLVLSAQCLQADTASSSFKFVSGSTGADGPLKLTQTECPTDKTVVTIDVGSSGIKHYESILVHANCIVKFTPVGNFSSPVYLIVKGDVVINGQLNLNGSPGAIGPNGNIQAIGGKGGPGGYDGGNAGIPYNYNTRGNPGYGLGGGTGGIGESGGEQHGQPGSLTPYNTDHSKQPLVGGSGGGGAINKIKETVGAGGGGGGAILIASSGKITVAGSISSIGGNGGDTSYHDGGKGADGMIHLIANTIDGSGSVNGGYINLETLNYFGKLTSNIYFNRIPIQQLTLNLNPGPSLAISSVDGQTVTPGVGITLDHSGSIQIGVTSTKLPADTKVTLIATNSSSSNNVVITLDNNGTASGKVTIGSGMTLVAAYVSGFVTPTASLQYQEEKIVTSRLEATLGQNSQMTFYTESGIPVPPQVARELNLERHVQFGGN